MLDYHKIGTACLRPQVSNPYFDVYLDQIVKMGIMCYYWPHLMIGLG